MASLWPAALDNFLTNRQNANPAAGFFQPVDANDLNNLADAVNKLETALGLNPKDGAFPAGTYADLVSRLNAVDAPTHKTITAPYSLIVDDLKSILFTNNTAAADITIPPGLNLPHGVSFTISQGSSGTFRIVAPGITLHSRGEVFTSAGIYSMVSITKVAASGDFYIVSGDIVAP